MRGSASCAPDVVAHTHICTFFSSIAASSITPSGATVHLLAHSKKKKIGIGDKPSNEQKTQGGNLIAVLISPRPWTLVTDHFNGTVQYYRYHSSTQQDGNPPPPRAFAYTYRLSDFWTTRCTNCPAALGRLDDMARERPSVAFVGVNIDSAVAAKGMVLEAKSEGRWAR